ncbi:MAG TPA: glycine cleavage T C-terminal barrel domain-containing protein [Pyrinomonadaceae bacterium]|nr:glycine cleavage T C-terminal barrel domain-containing protein [Pyrinomonadaceae bacterium]
MIKINQDEYKTFRENGYKQLRRGLIEVSGKEAVQFLNGLITNDAAKLADGAQMEAAFPNAQGRLLALVRVLRRGDKFLFETEEATREKVFQNLFRFTYAGDFFVADLSDDYRYFEVQSSRFKVQTSDFIAFQNVKSADYFVTKEAAENFKVDLQNSGAIEISDELYEILRIENGKPLYNVDMDETTIVPEIGLPDVISYNKGCYIGQEIIARIHFRGHVAKSLTGLIFENENAEIKPNDEIKSADGKNAGRVTSITFSPALEKIIALAFVRYDYLAEGTPLKIDDFTATVKDLPFVE